MTLSQKETNYNLIITVFEEMLFEENGNVDAVSMNNLVKKVGLTKRTIYKHFESKRELHFEVMIRGYLSMTSFIDEYLKEKNEHTVRTVFQGFYNYSLQHSEYYNLIMTYQTSEDDFDNPSERVKQCYALGQQTISYIYDAIKAGMDQGVYKKDIDLNETVIMVWSFAVGLLNNVSKKENYLKSYYDLNENKLIQNGITYIENMIKEG